MTEGKPFNGDSFIDAEIVKLVERFNVQTIIETGCKEGYTARRFRQMIPKTRAVHTIDVKEDHEGQEEDFKGSGIAFHLGNSDLWLWTLLRQCVPTVLAYLDAHGEGKSPLLDELVALSASLNTRKTCIVCIHDFLVPGRGELGHDLVDLGNGESKPLGMDLLRPYLKEIWPDGYAWHTNKEAEGDMRGIIYCYPLQP